MSYTNRSNSAVNSGFAAGNFDTITAKNVYAKQSGNSCGGSYPEVTNMIPVGTMETCSGLGDIGEVVVYDRYIYANRNSRLRSQGDPIRGDLPIVPCSGNQWFNVSVSPQIDLQAGALNVIAGVQNDTNQQLAELINYSSGGVEQNIGGVNMSRELSMINDYPTCFSSGYGDITVSSFP